MPPNAVPHSSDSSASSMRTAANNATSMTRSPVKPSPSRLKWMAAQRDLNTRLEALAVHTDYAKALSAWNAAMGNSSFNGTNYATPAPMQGARVGQ